MIALKIAVGVQMGFQWAFKIVRWWAPPDRIRQNVPSTRTGHGKGAVAQSALRNCEWTAVVYMLL